MDAWLLRHVQCLDVRGFAQRCMRPGDAFSNLVGVAWRQSERRAVTALLRVLVNRPHRVMRYVDAAGDAMWLSCGRDRVLAAVLVQRDGVLMVKRVDTPMHSRLLSALVGTVPNYHATQLFWYANFHLPRLLCIECVEPVESERFDEEFFHDASVWIVMLEAVADSMGRSFARLPDEDRLCAARVGRSKVEVWRYGSVRVHRRFYE